MARKITDKMFAFIDNKLKNNGAAQLAITSGLTTKVQAEKIKHARDLMIYAAEACVGIVEQGGNNKGLYIVELQKTVDASADQEPYCMAAVQTFIAYVEKKINITSPVYASEHCMTVFRSTSKSQRVVNIPAPGAIIIWKNGSTDSGHTGLVLDFQGVNKKQETLEANTGSGNMRDGDGIYIKQRSKTKDGKLVIQGYLRPF